MYAYIWFKMLECAIQMDNCEREVCYFQVYEEGIVAVKNKSNVERASHLLSVMYSILLDLDTFGPDVNMVLY